MLGPRKKKNEMKQFKKQITFALDRLRLHRRHRHITEKLNFPTLFAFLIIFKHHVIWWTLQATPSPVTLQTTQ